MHGRLALAIISTVLEITAVAVIALFGLPRIDVNIPVPVLAAIMLAWLGWSVFTYRKGSEALRRKVDCPEVMTGNKGVVVKPLDPNGLVKIKGELWVCRPAEGRIDKGTNVVVGSQDGLKLIVRSADSGRGGSPPVDNRNDDQGNPNYHQRQA